MTPSSSQRNEVTRSEQSVTARIDAAEAEVRRLYGERAGRYDGGRAWCCQCGRNVVNAEDGYDTCAPCIAELQGYRS